MSYCVGQTTSAKGTNEFIRFRETEDGGEETRRQREHRDSGRQCSRLVRRRIGRKTVRYSQTGNERNAVKTNVFQRGAQLGGDLPGVLVRRYDRLL